MFTMRFDMRAPEGGASTTDLYQAAIEMAAWAETRGGVAATISEHHAADDGYLPSPMLLASAIAARTQHLAIMVGAALLPFYDPVRLAEDMNVLDIISNGRVSYVFGIGYRPEEFEQFGVDMKQRGRVAEEKLALLLEARKGEPFVHDGRRIHVTPPPFTPGGAPIMWGGGSVAAAKRAGRYGLGFLAQTNLPGLQEAYEEECRAYGHELGVTMLPARDTPTTTFVADDVDKAWDEIGSYILHDARSYAEWNPGDETTASLSHAKTVDQLRAESTAHKIFSTDEAVEMVRAGGMLMLQPLCGGLPPELAWPYVERVAEVVLPRAQE